MNLFTRLLQTTLDRFVIPLNVYIQRRSQEALPVRTVQQELDARIAAESEEYVLQNMPTAIQFARREDLWDYAWSKKNPRGFIAEFGVCNGYSINRLAAKETQIIYGFDSFAGLNEEWTGAAPKREFDRGGAIPKVASNVPLIKGWFHESLPPFLSAHEGPFAFTHIDCDTYEATDVVLKSLDSRLQDGAIIVFDDYFGYRG
jgi:hypothetical protein